MPKSHYYKQSIVSDLHKRLEDTSRFLNEQTETVKETNELGKRMKSETDNISKKLKDQQTELKKKKEFAKKKQEEVKKLSNEISGLSKTIQRINDRFLSFSKDLGKDLENAKKKLDQEITKANTLVTEITSVLGDVGAADLLKELVLKIDDAANKTKEVENNLKEGDIIRYYENNDKFHNSNFIEYIIEKDDYGNVFAVKNDYGNVFAVKNDLKQEQGGKNKRRRENMQQRKTNRVRKSTHRVRKTLRRRR